jgi:nicotinic acid mononucleotide adenylyltransferase
MQEILGDHADADAFLALERWTRSTLERIGNLMEQGHIDPAGGEKQPVGITRSRLSRHSLRLGVFPTAGDPLHWGHLLGGLAAMERFQLDKVVYVVAGKDPRKPALTNEHIRHLMAKDVLKLFRPLFEYSPLALGTTNPGEVNVFRIFGANDSQSLHMFYLAGSDHAHRFAPRTGCPDTIQRLETGVRKRINDFNPRTHRLSVVFLDRGDRCEPVESFLDVRWIDHLPVRTSSKVIRGALSGQEPLCELAALPFTAYCTICDHGMYRTGEEDMGRRPSECDEFRRTGRTEDQSAAPRMKVGALGSGERES